MIPKDPSGVSPDAALLVIDLQRGTAANPFVTPIEDVVAHAGRLATAFRAHGMPVAVATFALGGAPGRSEPEGFGDALPEVGEGPEDLRVTRTAWSAFSGTDLDQQLRARGIHRLVVVGVATSIGVESTLRDAHDRGYELVVVADAVTDLAAETHENSIGRIFPMMAQVVEAAELLTALDIRP
ncbi:nicotinamidase-related amidase [Microbacterium terrae]|uniref:Isochorismatase family protein YecD n=1 Tax=Microbacterium terrae TaxID=69369 RepID=A0A0M2HG75_9MICO|nr:isochorismatase family protein [Microbacterium terrae]KJL45659.1 Isochorismatase family protein YecD [Microbacterium terrae]MBP1079507.1 nicotinamidase-related amidase [Microbacterium terrae]GLJ96848.1 hydrolase [Microbacterium terrae]